jgi:hypothetical protein
MHPPIPENKNIIVLLGLVIIRLLFIKYQRLNTMSSNEVKEPREKQ